MINKDLIELQKGLKSTAVIIKNEDLENLDSKIVINANYTDGNLLKTLKEDMAKDINYLVIEQIDKLDADKQDTYYQIVKDRELFGNELPKDTIIVFTVESKETLKNITQELYNLCVVAF